MDPPRDSGAVTPIRPASEAGTATCVPRVRRVIVELGCILCSQEVATLQCSAWPSQGPVLVKQPGGANMEVRDWRRLRCQRCGGSALPAEITLEDVRPQVELRWSDDPPRRGRPPKRFAARRPQSDRAC